MGLSGTPVAFPVPLEDRSLTAKARLGSKAYDALGNEYTYIKAGATLAVRDALRCAGSALGWDDVRPTSAAQQLVVGAAVAAFAVNEYGYVMTNGNALTKVVDSTAVGSLLVSSATAGTLALAVATDLPGRGASALTTSASSSTAGAQVLLQ